MSAPRLRAALAIVAVLTLISCGDSPTAPAPVVPPPAPSPTPVNLAPTIEAISVQGERPRQPASFADLSETVNVSATVRDPETTIDQLQYNWTATAGTFTGTGARVRWQAPAAAQTPALVTLTLEVVERYGASLEHRVRQTTDVRLHDSVKEVGDMARQFLLDFSNTDLKDASVVMRNFGGAATCPQPNEITSERADVINHYSNFRMMNFRIGPAAVAVNFGGVCQFRGKLGDACASVPVYWDSVDLRTNTRGAVEGPDILAATYSSADARWWLCSSDFDGRSVSGAIMHFYLRPR